MPHRPALRALALLALGALCFAAGAEAQRRFPNLEAAKRNAAQAIGDLQRAPEIFGGHKAAALSHLRAAIAEIDAAEAFAKR